MALSCKGLEVWKMSLLFLKLGNSHVHPRKTKQRVVIMVSAAILNSNICLVVSQILVISTAIY